MLTALELTGLVLAALIVLATAFTVVFVMVDAALELVTDLAAKRHCSTASKER